MNDLERLTKAYQAAQLLSSDLVEITAHSQPLVVAAVSPLVTKAQYVSDRLARLLEALNYVEGNGA